MQDQLFEEGEKFEHNGVELTILSVAQHTVEGEPAGFSYSFRATSDIEQDERIAQEANEKAQAEIEAANAPEEENTNEDEEA